MNSLIVIISNPASRTFSFKKVQLASNYLKQNGFEPRLLYTAQKGHGSELARAALSEKPHLIVAAGGDGTINEVINGMVGSDIPLGILPMGTTNVLAKELGIPEAIEGACAKLLTGSPKTVSLGKIVSTSQQPPASRYFCLMAGIGFDAGAVRGVSGKIKRLSGEGAYILSGIRHFFRYNPDELLFVIDGKEYTGYAAIIGKASRYGGRFRVNPDADIRDPYFYLCLLTGKNRRNLLRFAGGIIMGSHLKNPDVRYMKASHIEIRGATDIQLDGDYFGTTPATISIAPDALRLIF
jgi:YegS/Rv2252/BmrU family lipid kinase